MIRVDRGPEPAELIEIRTRRVARAMLALMAGKEIPFAEYDAVKRQLHDQQNGKCAYCERAEPAEDHPVEHFRPKEIADRGDPLARPPTHIRDRGRYWWLAWTWENLLFACVTCNGADHKGNWFPLEHGNPLPLPGMPECPSSSRSTYVLSNERPMLVDPSVDDPMEHIAWTPANPSAALLDLRWIPVHKTQRGRVTIEVLGLRGWLSDHVTDHVRSHVIPQRIERVLSLMQHGTKADVQTLWAETMAVLFAPRQSLQAATHDAIDHLVDTKSRASFGLTLPKPGAQSRGSTVAQPFSAPPLLSRVTDEVLRLRVCARVDATEDLLADLARHGPWTKQELAVVLGVKPVTVSKYLRVLHRRGLVQRTGPNQWG